MSEGVDTGINNEPDESEQKASCNVREPEFSEIRCKCKDQEHDCAGNIWCDGEEIGFYGTVVETCDYDWEEELDCLKGDTKTYFNCYSQPPKKKDDGKGVPRMTQLVGCLKIFIESLKLNFSLTTLDESTWIR